MGHDIRKARELLVYKDIRTTSAYAHVLNPGDRGVRSTADLPNASQDDARAHSCGVTGKRESCSRNDAMNPSFDAFLDDALSGGSVDFDYGSPSSAQSLLIEFNHRVPELVRIHGLDPVGKAVWYIYGCVSGTTRDALHPSADSALARFYDSIRVLYGTGFSVFCDDSAGHSDVNPNSFATACYMLWDMDSGLSHLTFRGRPELFRHGERLIDFGLSHPHAACQESFLHCLGHLHFGRPDFVHSKITRYLRRRDIGRKIRKHAKQCRTGMIM